MQPVHCLHVSCTAAVPQASSAARAAAIPDCNAYSPNLPVAPCSLHVDKHSSHGVLRLQQHGTLKQSMLVTIY